MLRQVVLASALLALVASYPTFTFQQQETEQLWQTFKTKYQRSYQNELEALRKQIFQQNLEYITRHNAEADLGQHTYWLGINQFTDMTNQEFRQRNTLKVKRSNSSSTFMAPENMAAAPIHVDWRKKGYVTPVKNQGQCGSCWAFSATGSLEGQHFRKTGKLVSLSEQNLVDCSHSEGNNGCEGGLMDQAFEYIKRNGGIDQEQCYAYEARDDTCRYKTACIGATVTGHFDVPSGDEDALKMAVASVGPVSVAIDASHPSFQSYSHGIYNEPECSSEALDHGVLAVGYGAHIGADNGEKDFWIVKNSWGENWGMHGYIHMTRNKNNQCGIATQASYPLV